MKHLKDIVVESFFDDELVDDSKHLEKTVKEEIKRFLKENYKGGSRCRISRKPNEDGKYVVDCKGVLYVSNLSMERLTTDTFIFGEISDSFNISRTRNLTSLEGAPKKVGGSFYCNDCTSLTSLEGAPEEVEETFSCSWCNSLTNLKGAPKTCHSFLCYDCESLTSLEGAPEEVSGDFYCNSCKKLTSFKGAPKKIGANFRASGCVGIKKSTVGFPKEIGGDVDVSDCGFQSHMDIWSISKIGGKLKVHWNGNYL